MSPASPPLGFSEGMLAAETMWKLRKARGLSQEALGAKLGKTKHWVSVREIGAVRMRAADAAIVAAAFGIDPDRLTGGRT